MEDKSKSTPSAETLKSYLHYQYPATVGDVLLNTLCDELKATQELQKDKERLEYLESLVTIHGEEIMGITFTYPHWTLREAIDAAITQQQKESK